MPTDSRRNQGPEDSVGYRRFIKNEESYAELRKRLVSAEGKRKDGRSDKEHRKLYMKTGIVTQAKGSAYIELGNTKVVVSVFDPREIPRLSEFKTLGELYCEFKFAPFSCEERRGHITDSEEKDLSGILKRALEPAVCRHEFPNFQVDIYALILENDGACLSAAIIASGLALADASIPLYDIITSVTVGVHDNLVFLDPTLEEEKLCKTAIIQRNRRIEYGLITLSYLSKDEQISDVSQIGAMSCEQISDAVQLLIKFCNEIEVPVKQCLVKNVETKIKESEEQ